ncbi:sugar phosphate isomerase/epimerase family protein [Bauldia litoralis]|uniref:D-psicose/D-tagatose/L-ribulose 3-epimerase n=1 Tax=Bauldia litoralis TaxID=665467 RepID=A0A1G6BV20_9HYPH|nr:sugar phosphate isomerase/epimerase family protein [Bauldia litoralis]SDB24481.1 D-psicose/D-tagatose/L-ribulose 3-epimerase [Bauldia litoralis]
MTANPIGIISMQFARPFTAEHFPLFKTIKGLGYDFIELLVPEPGELDLGKTRAALEAAGLGVVLAARVNLDRNLSSDDPARSQAGVDYLRTCIETAATLGATIVGGPLYGSPLVFAGRAPKPVDEAERLARKVRCVAGLQAVAGEAADAGIRLAVEPLNRFETDVCSTIAQGLELVEAVDRPAVGLMLDTFHMHMEEASLAEAILAAGKHIAHFQANENHRGFIGTGATDWTAVCRALAEVGYAGPISLEPFRRDDDRFGVPIAHWRPPHEDESEKLRASLALLRGCLAMAETRR